jgi:hypothetical protein
MNTRTTVMILAIILSLTITMSVPTLAKEINETERINNFVVNPGYYHWTTAGSTGTVDESDTSIVNLNGPSAAIKSSAILPANLDIRYNVVAVGSLEGGNTPAITVRFKDNGNQARVIIYLKVMNIFTGGVGTLMAIDSNDYPSSSSYQTRSLAYPKIGDFFDFTNNVYYIEAKITKTGTSGTPELSGIKLFTYLLS